MAYPVLTRAEQKQDLRARGLSNRDALSPDYRVNAAERIAEAGLPVAIKPGTIISAYQPIGSEMPIDWLLARLEARGAHFTLPAIVKQDLVFRRFTLGDALVTTGYGLRVPPPTAKLADPDVLLIPGAAFDDSGGRIGYGKGFFDRALARLRHLKPVVAIGIAFDAQFFASIPMEPHDERLDFIVSESGVRFAGARRD